MSWQHTVHKITSKSLIHSSRHTSLYVWRWPEKNEVERTGKAKNDGKIPGNGWSMQSYILTCSRLNTENLFVVLASSVKWRTLISVYPMPHRGSQRRKGSERTVTPQQGQDQKVVRSKLALCSDFLWHSSLKTPVSLYFFNFTYLFIYLLIYSILFILSSLLVAS